MYVMKYYMKAWRHQPASWTLYGNGDNNDRLIT